MLLPVLVDALQQQVTLELPHAAVGRAPGRDVERVAVLVAAYSLFTLGVQRGGLVNQRGAQGVEMLRPALALGQLADLNRLVEGLLEVGRDLRQLPQFRAVDVLGHVALEAGLDHVLDAVQHGLAQFFAVDLAADGLRQPEHGLFAGYVAQGVFADLGVVVLVEPLSQLFGHAGAEAGFIGDAFQLVHFLDARAHVLTDLVLELEVVAA